MQGQNENAEWTTVAISLREMDFWRQKFTLIQTSRAIHLAERNGYDGDHHGANLFPNTRIEKGTTKAANSEELRKRNGA